MTFSHRNGETEPPIVATDNGLWFWFDGEDNNSRPQDEWFGVFWVTDTYAMDTRGEKIPLGELPGKWWGPLTPPWETDAARPTHYHPFAEDDVRAAFSSDVKPLFDDEQGNTD